MGIFSRSADRDKAEAALYAASPSLFGKAPARSRRNGTAPAPCMAPDEDGDESGSEASK